jgi:hypothetical protein
MGFVRFPQFFCCFFRFLSDFKQKHGVFREILAKLAERKAPAPSERQKQRQRQRQRHGNGNGRDNGNGKGSWYWRLTFPPIAMKL